MTKYEDIIKQKANKEPIDIDAIARKYNMSVTDVKKLKDDRGPLDLTRQIGELQCEIAGLKTKIHDAELETSLVKAVGMNSPEMKAAKEEINDLKNKIASLEECLNSRDYTRQHDYKFLIDENHRLEQQYLEIMADNKKLAQQIEDQVDRLRKSGM
jgi:predicted  nucleic acid-binding Zn-ribbon protein